MAAEEKTETKDIKKANTGDKIKVVKGEQKGKKGKVLVVRENSVIIEVGKHPETGEPIKTVVNHKNYKSDK
ncbi:DUF2187 family protein [Oceanobacillus halophilus]|uniref:DUF2187 domain-containing protein n=1 Tax=Oceanobacillus halophilus TaxID=930130 RepID=A0A494ZYZ9_9BACI|nr:DUF2187 family protein [Oceanobacillus halophilus]RKQ31336.1 DUF2187 domain-containing protein [Oceanobacillus halophilus]